MRLPWRKPRPAPPFEPCDQMCPHSVEQRIADMERDRPGLPLAAITAMRLTPAEVDDHMAKVVSEMRAIAATLPPPCGRCPAMPGK